MTYTKRYLYIMYIIATSYLLCTTSYATLISEVQQSTINSRLVDALAKHNKKIYLSAEEAYQVCMPIVFTACGDTVADPEMEQYYSGSLSLRPINLRTFLFSKEQLQEKIDKLNVEFSSQALFFKAFDIVREQLPDESINTPDATAQTVALAHKIIYDLAVIISSKLDTISESKHYIDNAPTAILARHVSLIKAAVKLAIGISSFNVYLGTHRDTCALPVGLVRATRTSSMGKRLYDLQNTTLRDCEHEKALGRIEEVVTELSSPHFPLRDEAALRSIIIARYQQELLHLSMVMLNCAYEEAVHVVILHGDLTILHQEKVSRITREKDEQLKLSRKDIDRLTKEVNVGKKLFAEECHKHEELKQKHQQLKKVVQKQGDKIERQSEIVQAQSVVLKQQKEILFSLLGHLQQKGIIGGAGLLNDNQQPALLSASLSVPPITDQSALDQDSLPVPPIAEQSALGSDSDSTLGSDSDDEPLSASGGEILSASDGEIVPTPTSSLFEGVSEKHESKKNGPVSYIKKTMQFFTPRSD